ncbi:MAG TPA: CPBP family intramembrane glutamic endopeptidase [Candidatus Acidoferrales bacterium]|nr:CPBP family intramembrane glutamic endopeptidase [Candidatus Acidoferrales bacterium]
MEKETDSTTTAHPEFGKLNNSLVLLSPLLVIIISFAAARIFKVIWGVWAWAPGILIYWIAIAILIWWGGGRSSIKRWLGSSKGGWGWSVFAVILALPALPMILTKSHLLHGISIWLPWLLLGLINPFLEEGYWRGLVLDSTSKWSKWLSVPYSALFFALNHLVGLGTTSIACRNPIFLANVFIIGICFGIIYYRTGSLRWLIFSHALTDLFSLSVPVFLNLYVPPL